MKRLLVSLAAVAAVSFAGIALAASFVRTVDLCDRSEYVLLPDGTNLSKVVQNSGQCAFQHLTISPNLCIDQPGVRSISGVSKNFFARELSYCG